MISFLPGLGAILQAAVVFGLFLFAPGYVAGWFSNVFEFRRASMLRRIPLGVALSSGVTPSAVYLAWKLGNLKSVWWLFGVVWVLFAVVFAADLWKLWRGRSPAVNRRLLRVGVIGVVVWTAIALASLPDIRSGRRLYYSVTAFDYASRVPMASDLGDIDRLPPQNPYFNPGRRVPLRYHYFWPLLCGLVPVLSGGWLGVRDAMFAGTLWAGAALLSAIALYLRLFYGIDGKQWKTYATGIALLGVTGLDILPVLVFDLLLYWQRRWIYPTVEWWNEQVTAWLDSMLWVPHNVVALVAGLTAILVLWKAVETSANRRVWIWAALAAAALASVFGLSIYVALVFDLFLLAWAFHHLLKRRYTEFGICAAAGVLALLFGAPFLREIVAAPGGGGGGGGAGGGWPIVPAIRDFRPATVVVDALMEPGTLKTWLSRLLSAVFLPFSYFLEFGAFFYAAVLYFRNRRGSGAWSRNDTVAATMLATSVAVSTFLRSSVIKNNDLGWRGIMPAQFILLLWAVPVLRSWGSLKSGQRRWLARLVTIGVVTTVCDLALLRFYVPALDAPSLGLYDKVDPDRRLGERNGAIAQAYAWIRRNTPKSAVVQVNPAEFEYQYGLYAERKSGVAWECSGFGPSPAECGVAKNVVSALYARGAPEGAFEAVCARLPIDLVLVRDLDPAWSDRNGWVWRRRPVFENGFMRVFGCPVSGGQVLYRQSASSPRTATTR